MAVNKVAALSLFGLGLTAAGAMWMLFNEGIMTTLISKFWVTNTSSPTYSHMRLMETGWHVIPIIIMIIGIIALVVSGMQATKIEED
jgi:hypothetical protein